ncbi:HXXEE domain-containing protein [Amycolatopsis sp. NPDC003861]
MFIVHTLEELPGFAMWVSAHFAHLTTEKFAVTHIPLILLVLLTSWRASRPTAATGWIVLATAFQWQFAANAAVHLAAAIRFGEYSPGMVTVALSVTATYLAWLRRRQAARSKSRRPGHGATPRPAHLVAGLPRVRGVRVGVSHALILTVDGAVALQWIDVGVPDVWDSA